MFSDALKLGYITENVRADIYIELIYKRTTRTYPYYFWILCCSNEESFVWFDTKGAAPPDY